MTLTTARVILSDSLAQLGSMAGPLLIDEVQARTDVRWETTAWPQQDFRPVIWVGTEAELKTLPEILAAKAARLKVSGRPEGYRVTVMADNVPPTVLVIGHDARGALFGVGLLLRKLRMNPGRITVPGDLDVTTSPYLAVRGDQLGYDPTTNSYDAWDMRRWEQCYRDLIVFGANAVELIPPHGKLPDPALESSQLLPLPLDEMLVEMSALAHKYDLDVWAWYPSLQGNYADPAVVREDIQRSASIFRRMPRLDNLFVPGGDPGYTRPSVLMPFLAQKAALLHRHHPQAGMWVSPQNFGAKWMEEFITLLRQEPAWLTGVVYGPNVGMPLLEFRQKVPAHYPIRSYADISHTVQCQYPVPQWDAAYALTEGRRPVVPRPLDQATIFHHELPHIDAAIPYSEGCTDDVNKVIWNALAWNPQAEVIDILRDYGRYFSGPEFADDFAQGLLALERNWRGPLSSNRGVRTTLEQFQDMERRASPGLLRNWRFEMALYRAYYDAYIERRLLYETELDTRALDILARAPDKGAMAAMEEATTVLNRVRTDPAATAWRERIFELGDNLFQDIGLQLSVEKHHATAVDHGANLDTIDFPLNNRRWLLTRFAEIRRLPDEAARLRALQKLVGWQDPGPGGFYDDLGDPAGEPHLVRGARFAADPGRVHSAADDFELIKDLAYYRQHPFRYSWLSRAATLRDTPLCLRYTGLDPTAEYRVRVVYAAEDAFEDSPPALKLTANGRYVVHRWLDRPLPPEPLEFPVPPAATTEGVLELELIRKPSDQGNGRGTYLSEVWLLKDSA